jgi:hypothetical protein
MNASPDAAVPHTHDAPPSQADSGRDASGRFTKGNPGGRGEPYYRRQAQLKRVMLETVTEDDVRSVMQVLLGLARGGDPAAIKLLLAYTVGKPCKEVDPDGADLHEWGLHRQTPRLGEVGGLMAEGIQTCEANRVARDVVPIVGACHLQTLSLHLRSGTDLDGEQVCTPPKAAPPAEPNGGKRPCGSARRMATGLQAADSMGDNGGSEGRAWNEMRHEDLADAVQTGEIDVNEVFLRSRGLGTSPRPPASPDSR